ncbi:MAG: CAP domain-containing protein [Actinomycetota bacterium]|nr:CAP domain-containing protein [Actinomycetota bacterium]
MRRTAVIALLATILSLLIVPFAPSASAADVGAENQFLSLLNGERTSRGLGALSMRAEVVPVARSWTARLISDQALSHNPSLSNQMPSDWISIGENVGFGSTVESLHNAFMNSPGHRANIVGDFHQVGIGVDRDDRGRLWVTVDFMKSRNPQVVTASPTVPAFLGGQGGSGYWMVGADGVVYAFGGATHHGNAATSMAEDLEPTPSKGGYWVVSSAGTVYSFGNAPHLGGIDGALAPTERVTSISATPSGRGYWLFTTLGRVAAFGDAPHLGDMSGTRLNGAVLDSIPTPTGRGYYMVASDGGIFSFGDADFRGSMGGSRLNAPVQSLVPDSDNVGYWLVAADGGIFAFDAEFHGSMGATRLNKPITGMVAFGPGGYLMVGEDGGIFTFGTADFHGSLGDRQLPRPITSVAVRQG